MKEAHSDKPAKRKKPVRRLPVQRRKLAGVTISIQRCRNGRHAARVVINAGGRRITRSFVTLEEAKGYAQRQEIEAQNTGARGASEIGDSERRMLLEVKDELAVHGKTLRDAVNFYLEHLKAAARSAPVAEMMKTLMAHKRAERRSARYLQDLKSRLGRFTRDYGTRPIGEMTAAEISVWLAGLNLNPTGTNNFRRCLAVLFNYAAARGYCAAGLMRQTTRVKAVDKEPEILTVAECSALLHAAAPEVRAGLALALFTGLRDAELKRLDWQAVDLDAEVVIVGSAVSKVSQRRTIPIRPNLKEWLLPLRQPGGEVLPSINESRLHIERARRAAGFGREKTSDLRPWPNNGLRHSYASYRLAMWPDAAALALEMGNSPGVIIRHYRNAVKPAAAQAFWSLTPGVTLEANSITFKTA